MAPRVLVAHVLDAPAADAVDGLRRALGGELDRIVPHVTLVPPSNVAPGHLDDVLGELGELAAATEPIALHLGRASTFLPRRGVCYLAVEGEVARLAALASAAASGALTPPASRAPRTYVPHVTVANHLEHDRLEAALAVIGPLGLDIPVRRLVVLAEDESQPHRPWQLLADAHLSGRITVGTGGRALALEVHELVDPTLRAFAATERPDRPLRADSSSSALVAVTARLDAHLVGLGVARLSGALANLEYLVVATAHRSEGIGTAVLSRLELEASRRNATVLALKWSGEDALARFASGRGYQPAGIAGGGDAVLERAL